MNGVNENNLIRLGPAEGSQTTPFGVKIAYANWKSERSGEEYSTPRCTFSAAHWRDIGSEQHGHFIPLSGLVASATIQAMLQSLAHAHDSTLQKKESRTYEIVAARGRCVEVRSLDYPFLPWKELAAYLLGSGKPCEDFHVASGNTIFASLKVAAQTEIEGTVSHFESDVVPNRWTRPPTVGELAALADTDDGDNDPTRGFSKFINGIMDGETTRPAAPAAFARKDRKPLKGAQASVMKAMKVEAPSGAIATEKLVLAAVKLMPARKDTRGVDRRKDYAGRAVDQLVEKGYLYVHGADQSQVSLTACEEVAE
jgi:hypothetical protein